MHNTSADLNLEDGEEYVLEAVYSYAGDAGTKPSPLF